jgi:hypothetical protein
MKSGTKTKTWPGRSAEYSVLAAKRSGYLPTTAESVCLLAVYGITEFMAQCPDTGNGNDEKKVSTFLGTRKFIVSTIRPFPEQLTSNPHIHLLLPYKLGLSYTLTNDKEVFTNLVLQENISRRNLNFHETTWRLSPQQPILHSPQNNNP